MNMRGMTVVDIIGLALILGLLLRYGQEASQLIASGSAAFNSGFNTVGLVGGGQSVGGPAR